MEWVVMGLIISKRLVWEKRPRYPNPKTAPVEDIIRLGQEYMTSWELVRLVPSRKTQSLAHSKKIHETWLRDQRTRLLPRAWRTARPSFKNVNMEFHFTNSFSIDHLIKNSFAAYGVALQLINKKNKNEKLSKTKLSLNQASSGRYRSHFDVQKNSLTCRGLLKMECLKWLHCSICLQSLFRWYSDIRPKSWL